MCPHSCTKSTECTKPCTHTRVIPQKNTLIPSMAQTCHPLNNQAFAIFFPSVTIPAMLQYSEVTDKYSLHLYFMANILFLTFLTPLPPTFLTIQEIQSATQSSYLSKSPLPFSSHSAYFPSLYPKPAVEHYPQEITNILCGLVDSDS